MSQFLVVDGGITLTGSFNLTASASNKNYENVLAIASTSVATAYATEFDDLWVIGSDV